jgi:2-polyprenyl-3-methyl-5-hydroxy-6-metoxy-1,4-benzoquinol methylase
LFWRDTPASLVESTFRGVDLTGARVLDLGCGEGKNAAFLAGLGATVRALDVSAAALQNAERHWGAAGLSVEFAQADVRELSFGFERYDVVISYGLLHCLGGMTAARGVTAAAQEATKPGGVHVVCALNSRLDGFSEGHIDFRPTLLTHENYAALYRAWQISELSDRNLTESHPPNYVEHTHAVTRFVARRP